MSLTSDPHADTLSPSSINDIDLFPLPPSSINANDLIPLPPSSINANDLIPLPPSSINANNLFPLPPSSINAIDMFPLPASSINANDLIPLPPSSINASDLFPLPPSSINAIDMLPLPASSINAIDLFPSFENPYLCDDNEDSVEYLGSYCYGGYHPTLIGDTFENGQYVVIHKLGHGAKSTVWLAQNTLLPGEYVTLKILTAIDSDTSNEHNIIAHLHTNYNPGHPGYPYVAASLTGWFRFLGPNGYHLCLVGEVIGCTLQSCKSNGEPKCVFPINTSRAIAAQVIMGLAYMHSLGVCHGDLDLSNIQLYRPIQGLPVEEIYERYGVPDKISLQRKDKTPIGLEAPSYLVRPMVTSVPSHEVKDCRVKISDFSSAFMVSHESKDVGISLLVTPPEALFDKTLTFSMDIWSLGCTLYSILGDGSLFFSLFGTKDNLIEDMVAVLGPLPGPWWERWEGREEYFSKDGKAIMGDKFESANIDYRLSRLRLFDSSETSGMTKAEVASLKALLSVMLVYNPPGRFSADEILTTDYMRNWAEPALVEAFEKGELELYVPSWYDNQ